MDAAVRDGGQGAPNSLGVSGGVGELGGRLGENADKDPYDLLVLVPSRFRRPSFP
jgi:hypothetical protein